MTTSSAMSTSDRRHNPGVGREVTIGVVGATGAVGPVTLELLRERGYQNLRAFASARSAGKQLDGLTVEEATPEALSAGDLDVCLFSIGTAASRELVPHAVRGGAVAIDKSSAYRLQDGIPLVVPEVNGARALEHDGIVANPNCASIPLTCVLKPLHDAVGVARVRLATYQSASRMSRAPAGQPVRTRCSSAGSAPTGRPRATESRSSSPATTCARAPR